MSKPTLLAIQQSSRFIRPQRTWTCQLSQCRRASNFKKKSFAETLSHIDTSSPYYVTTPIFYANDSPHIGHLYSMVLADVIKRWQLQQGRPAVLSTGTDEHGLKIQRAAQSRGVSPQELCDANAAKFEQLARMAGISFDHFTRTSSETHKNAVSCAWKHFKKELRDNLALYEGTHKGWYSVADECFYPEDKVGPSVEPRTGRKMRVSKETGSEVEWIEEKTWFFPMTEYKMRLLDFYDRNPRWISPKARMAEVRSWVETNLEDLAVTRPTSRLDWGVRDPTDAGQTIYVWVDALLNYIVNAGYGSKWTKASQAMSPWPANVHVVGKDILRFHAVYWPCLLMALDLPLPKSIVCHNHWVFRGRKMSKTVGNVVDPFLALQRWDVDTLRFYLMFSGTLRKDMPYSNALIQTVYIKQLQANLGNLFYRVCRPKSNAAWSVGVAVQMHHDKSYETLIRDEKGERVPSKYFRLIPILKRMTAAFAYNMSLFDIKSAIKEVGSLLQETNRYFSDAEPWHLAKLEDEKAQTLLHWVVFNCAEALRLAGILLLPIIPAKAAELLDELGVSPKNRTAHYAYLGEGDVYGEPLKESETEGRLKKWDTLFPPLPDTESWRPEDMVPEEMKEMVRSKTKNKLNQLCEVLAQEARLADDGRKSQSEKDEGKEDEEDEVGERS
ncbi:hypothetical protein XA68_18421 [Ophiocordyceps unilateralis]|uniref:Methionine--tRNA ligase, mitochondrial n=1 Tax=Ophiocordyceps unilateralis TaxID=268505 RepID=A0A2A9PJE1_OPHUN|nr:hypothetical protein XA68_18421 [Ophiocordyceps unilateralis]